VLGALLAAAVASPWVAWALEATVGPFTFSRVFDRTFQVLLVVGLIAVWRRLDLGGAAALGFRRGGAGRSLAVGLLVGGVGLAVGLGLCALAGALEPELRYPPGKTLWKAILGLGAAILLGAGEETLFRGVLLRRLARDAGMRAAVAVTTIIYAVVHVLRLAKVPGPVDAWSGLERLAALWSPLARPETWPPAVGLALVGLLLAAARLRSGALWVPIGIHAAWVAVFRVGRLFFEIAPEPTWLVGAGWPPLVGGAAAWVAAGVGAALLPALVRRDTRPGG
jgi:membrane protease YdiL (CAAX protease family)